jgi:hypothetical protein
MRRVCLAFVASLFLAAPAAAGGCCGGYASYEVQPSVPVATYRFDAPPPVSEVYVVNQGPVLSGPGLYTYTNHYEPSFVPTAYPYVGGCGGYGGCGHSYSYGCGSCGHTYSYGCGTCGHSYGYGYGYGGYGYGARGYWPNTVAPYRGYAGHAWRGYYRGYRHHHVPLAANVAPARGY